MLRGFLIFCVLCTASQLFTVKAHPGKMRILPGLTFYHTDDNIGGTQSLNEEDRKLLNTVLQIVSRPEMQQVLNDLQNTIQNRDNQEPSIKPPGSGGQTGAGGSGGLGGGLGGGSGGPIGGSGGPIGGPVGSSLDHTSSISGSNSGLSSLPIATINVYPGYPGAQMLNDGRRMYQPRSPEGPPTLDTVTETYDDDTVNDASPVMDPNFGHRKFFMGDSMNELKDALYPHGADDYANQNYPIANDNYFDGSSSYHQMLPALDRRSLSKLQQKEDFTTQEDVQGPRRLMQFEKPSPHFGSLMFPTH